MDRRDVSRVLFGTAVGAALLTQRADAQTCTAPCYARTAAEIAAGVTPYDTTFVEGDIRRYGAVDLTGATDSSAAINTAISVNRPVLFPQGDIRWNTKPTLASQASLILRGVGAGTGGSSVARTRLWVGNQTGYTFTVDNSSSLIEMLVQGLEIDGANGGNLATAASSSWSGFISVTKTSGNGFRWALFDDLHVHSTAVASGTLIDIGAAYAVELRRVFATWATNGFAIRAGVSGWTTTTVTLSKCYVHGCRQGYAFGSNVTDVTFNDSIIESCCVAGHALLAKVNFNDCYFENIGYDPLSLGRGGITKMSGGISYGNALDTTDSDCAFTQVYGELTLNGCRFSNMASPLNSMVHAIGMGSSIGADGAIVVNGGTNTDTGRPFFRNPLLSERSNFVFLVNDPVRAVVASIGIIRTYADLRKITQGVAWVQFPSSAARFAKIERGRFVYGLGLEATYSGGLADQPTGGQNEIGDRVLVTTPVMGGPTQYVCTTAGSPGTWRPAAYIT